MTKMCYTGFMVGTWVEDGVATKVEIRWDEDGDADVRPYGSTDPASNWTVYRDHMEGLSW